MYKSHHKLVEVSQKDVSLNSKQVQKVGLPAADPVDDKNLTILFYYDGYDSDASAQHYVGLMQAALKSVEPFASSSNVKTRVFTSPNRLCHIQKKG